MYYRQQAWVLAFIISDLSCRMKTNCKSKHPFRKCFFSSLNAVLVQGIVLYAFCATPNPTRLHLVTPTSTLPANRVPPQKHCKPTQFPLPTITPAIGLPIRIPHAAQKVFIPNLPPTVPESSVMLTTVLGCKLTNAPEKAPYSSAQTINPADVCSTGIQRNPSIPATSVQSVRMFSGPVKSAM